MPGPIFNATITEPNQPWWFKGLLTAIVTVGVPVILSLGLVYYVVFKLDGNITNIQDNMRSHQLDTGYMIKTNDEQNYRLKVLEALLTQICINGSKTNEDRNNCWNAWNKVK